MIDKNRADLAINRDEFADLIFSQNENLTVDLEKIAPIEAVHSKKYQ
jgi:hypothetical protein